MKKVKVILKKSVIGQSKRQKETVKTLGLKRINSEAVHNLTPDIEGKIDKVSHLVKVEEV